MTVYGIYVLVSGVICILGVNKATTMVWISVISYSCYMGVIFNVA